MSEELYQGIERRVRCDGHDKLMEQSTQNNIIIQQMQKMLDEMHRDIQANGRIVTELNRIVTNGLSSRVKETHENVEKLCVRVKKLSEEHDGRLEKLEEFAWFRDMITKFRNNMFFTVMKLSGLIFMILVLANLADRTVITALVSAIHKALGIS